MYIYTYNIHTYVCVCVHLPLSLSLSLSIYIYIYFYTHTCTKTSRRRSSWRPSRTWRWSPRTLVGAASSVYNMYIYICIDIYMYICRLHILLHMFTRASTVRKHWRSMRQDVVSGKSPRTPSAQRPRYRDTGVLRAKMSFPENIKESQQHFKPEPNI